MERCLLFVYLSVALFAAIATPAPPKVGVVDVALLQRPTRIKGSQRPQDGNIRDAPAPAEVETATEGEATDEEGAEEEVVLDEIHCIKEPLGNNTFYWSSPNFGKEDYPNDAYCKVSSSSTEPGYATVSFNSLNILCEGRGDSVTFKQPYHIDDLTSKKYCGVMTESSAITSILPTYNFFGKFRTDHTGTASGFNVTITKQMTNCHKIIETGEHGNSGIIETPTEPNAGPAKVCEWWIRAPVGKRIELQFIPTLTESPLCNEGSILVDSSGSKFYRRRTTDSYCGKATPGTIISKKNYMNVLYYSMDSLDHFTARWALLSAF
ncbi:cubilin-like [Macrobrachium nipponense]|uniref:cubilin-like n=1 Tax=Macrobrachium nipponense TaxID=159736 RepID=UPI0030C8D448